MPLADPARKHLIVVSIACNGQAGSEPGKGYHWTAALNRLYRVHLVHGPEARFESDDTKLAGVERHATAMGVASWNGLGGYWEYHRWCQTVLESCRDLMSRYPIAGLHHITLGSFRLLPRYDLLGIPYSLGPLGGGEFTPQWVFQGCEFPVKVALSEAMRPTLNRLGVLRPAIRKVLRGARRLIATTTETAELLRLGGGREVIVRFPDVVEISGDSALISEARARQCEELGKEVQLIWSGRGLWWKGGQIALRFLRQLRDSGIAARLHIYSSGPCIPALQDKAAQAGLGDQVEFHSPVPRTELLQIYGRMHLFVYPTTHDSSSSAIPEAYAMGLPSMTLGIGGVGVAADPEAGLNRAFSSLGDWLSAGVQMVKGWQKEPRTWLAASQVAQHKSADFAFERLCERVAQDLAIY